MTGNKRSGNNMNGSAPAGAQAAGADSARVYAFAPRSAATAATRGPLERAAVITLAASTASAEAAPARPLKASLTRRWLARLFTPLALAISGAVMGQPDFDKVEIVTHKVAEGIYMLEGEGGNIGLSVGADGVFMIDDQYAPLTDKIRQAVAAISDQPIRFVLNTHWHFDHTGGNENFGRAGSLIVAHDNVRKRMSTDQFIEFFKASSPPSPKAALPVVTYDNTISFHLNGDTISAFHAPPAHTDGDSVVQFKNADVIHTGDIFFNGLYPFIDSSSGGSVHGMLYAIDRILLLATDKSRIIPGHGPLASRADLQRYRDMLDTVAARISIMLNEGKSRAAVIAAKPTADYDAEWGNGFLKPDVWVGLLYDNLRQSNESANRRGQ